MAVGQPAAEKRNVVALILCFCIFAGLFLFLHSPYFSIKEFEVSGNQRVETEEVLARCALTHPNIFAFDVDKAQKLVESHPWIKSASLKRKLPDKILVSVTERVPVAFAPMGDVMWLLDEEGRVLGQDCGDWPTLAGLSGIEGDLSPGAFIGDEYMVGLRVLGGLGPLSKRRLAEINVQGGDCTLILDDGCVVLFGAGTVDRNKILLLDSILADLDADGLIAERIDLRYDKQAIKLRYSKARGR